MAHVRYICAAVALIAALPAARPALAEDAGAIALAMAAADARDWQTARDAAKASGPLGIALIDWTALRAGQGGFSDYLAFVQARPGWPGMDLLRQRGTARLNETVAPADVAIWLGDGLPDSLLTENAYLATLPPDAAKAERERFWTNVPLNAAESAAFVAAHGDELQPRHQARIANLLDAGEWQAAEIALTLLPEPERDLPRARIALQAGRGGVDDMINALPADLRADAGLALDRYRWRIAAKLNDLARDLMLERSTSAEALRRPEIWAPRRVDWARAAMRAGDWALAERLATNHFLPEGDSRYADLEWLAGYAALKQGAADRALAHFLHLETQVGSAISQSRAFYWQGRALDAAGDTPAAQAAYARGAAHPGTYYGQLSAEKIGTTMPVAFAVTGRAAETLPDWRGSDLSQNEIFEAALWLIAINRQTDAQRFLLQLAATAQPDDIARMSRLMLEAGAPWHALRLSKQAASKGAIYPAAHFPLTGLENTDLGLPPELVLSIARQESEFNHTVTSHADARGLMQVMPETARMMAAQIREPFDLARLTRDPAYNARLGAAYLSGLRDRFGTSVALTASGYNAGPGRPARWLGDFGDLRRDADPVDWVEMIPFDETRNYVMRVTEAQPIYRARITGKPAPIVPTWDLTGGGLMPPPPLRLTLAMSKPPVPKPFIGPRLPVGWVKPAAPPVVTPIMSDRPAFRLPTGVTAPSAAAMRDLPPNLGVPAPAPATE